MSGDYSRRRFDPRKHFSGVLKQQGRVDLDAEWNEYVELQDRRWRAETIDLVGRCGVPSETPDGFKIGISNGQITIGQGRIYVDGLLAEHVLGRVGRATGRPRACRVARSRSTVGVAVLGVLRV